jgi:rhodanese-related sulfurtransferase
MNKKHILFPLVVLLVLSMALGACAPAPVAEAPVKEVEEVAEVVEEVEEVEEVAEVEEPEVVEEEAMFDEAELDAIYTAYLGNMEKYYTTSPEALNTAIAEGNAPFIIDVRRVSELEEKGHIEGAINIPLDELGMNVDKLPALDSSIVVYCAAGWRAAIGGTALGGLGFTDVKILTGGSFGGWVGADYPVVEGVAPEATVLGEADVNPALVAEFDRALSSIPEGFGGITAEGLNTALAESPDLYLIDDRTMGEMDTKGYIEAANRIALPLQDFIADKDMWPADKDAQIIIHCGSGHRSTMAMMMMWAYGYTNVSSLKGGFGGWTSAGYPVVFDMTALDMNYADMLANMEKYNTYSPEALNTALAEGNAPFIIDVRRVSELEEKGHIEGAINIPLDELGKNVDKLPALDTPVVVYCAAGWRAAIGGTALSGLGFTDVKILTGGSFGGWVGSDYPVVEGVPAAAEVLDAAEVDADIVAAVDASLAANMPEGFGGITAENLATVLIESPDHILIDVRRAEEVASKGFISADNWSHIALEEFIANGKLSWPADKEADITIYCGSGHRSTMAAQILWANGYTNVTSLKGGFGGWVGAGFPISVQMSALDVNYAGMLANMEKYNTYSPEALNTAIAEGNAPFIIDVRRVSELEEKGHIEGAINIPLDELGMNVDKLPALDTPVVVYCAAGWRAAIAGTALGGLGFTDVKILTGGSFGGWVEAAYPVVEGVPAEAEVLDVAVVDADIVAAVDASLAANMPEGFGGIVAENLATALIENPDHILIDVRRMEELEEKGRIDAANFVHVALEEFVVNGKLSWPADKDADITIYCGSGHRSTMAAQIFWANGYTNVTSLKGGFGGWAGAELPVVAYEMMAE